MLLRDTSDKSTEMLLFIDQEYSETSPPVPYLQNATLTGGFRHDTFLNKWFNIMLEQKRAFL